VPAKFTIALATRFPAASMLVLGYHPSVAVTPDPMGEFGKTVVSCLAALAERVKAKAVEIKDFIRSNTIRLIIINLNKEQFINT
jgi:hypothetical protein